MLEKPDLRKMFRDRINIRDLGGYQTQDSRKIRTGMIYRSGGLFLMDSQELENLNSLHLKMVLDLRSVSETERHPDPKPAGVQYMQTSGVLNKYGKEIDFSPAGMRQQGNEAREKIQSLKHYYMEMPYDNHAFHILFEQLLNGNAPLLFHCAAGKDRTGVAAMLLLKALGVSDEITIEDYLLSNEYMKDVIRNHMEEERDAIRKDPLFRELAFMRKGVKKSIGVMVLEGIKARSGSYERFFKLEYGMGPAELAALRFQYLE
ncbi:MAG: tyrosine-protein phosphatase [Erysipelotrichia bacterium]|nr:tyrosine-protein phosphatase [Erysipelotrichia bacterium]